MSDMGSMSGEPAGALSLLLWTQTERQVEQEVEKVLSTVTNPELAVHEYGSKEKEVSARCTQMSIINTESMLELWTREDISKTQK